MIFAVAREGEPEDLVSSLEAQVAKASSSRSRTAEALVHLISTLEQTASVLDQAAHLAEIEASRRASAGREGVDEEFEAAARARQAARDARARAEEWLHYLQEKAG